MFKDKAELVGSDGGVTIATSYEVCEEDGLATAKLVFTQPIELREAGSLAVMAINNSTPVISIDAKSPDGSVVREFGGRSAVGCLPDHTEVSLVHNMGGALQTLWLYWERRRSITSH